MNLLGLVHPIRKAVVGVRRLLRAGTSAIDRPVQALPASPPRKFNDFCIKRLGPFPRCKRLGDATRARTSTCASSPTVEAERPGAKFNRPRAPCSFELRPTLQQRRIRRQASAQISLHPASCTLLSHEHLISPRILSHNVGFSSATRDACHG
jgi:hypothetical protein